MSSIGPLPASIKYLQPLLTRARELEVANPIISYFCKLHAVRQIISSKLHIKDEEVKEFATALLDEIEKSKVENPELTSEHAVSILSDDAVARAYVEAFALKVFAKADKDIYNKTTTRNTANAFTAAAVFYDVVRSFDPEIDPETAEKVKYSKYQAARILKAYKNNENPNDYDPPALKEESVESDYTDLLLNTTENPPLDRTTDIQEENQKEITSSEPPDTTFQSQTSFSAPDFQVSQPSSQHIPQKTPEIIPQSSFTPSASVSNNEPVHIYTRDDAERIMSRTSIISSAQKQAKFAISALNYEDIDTAVKELTNALDLLSKLPKD